MKVKNYAVSVQHGQGHHYFLRTDFSSETEAYEAGQAAAKRASKKGPKPTVYVWLRRYSIGAR